ncbi:MAG: M56 family metallopeptidase [Oscillospiraceae bacterium]|nr:M56 family metallopeptidase [Oscillospiraceae bacterium]
MRDIWAFLLQTLTASGVAALLLAVKAMFRDKLSPRWQFSAWGILAVMLMIPAGLGGRYVLVNWPLYVETAKSVLTGEFGTLAKVTAPVPLPSLAPLHTVEDWLFFFYTAGAVLLLIRYVASYVCLRLALRRGIPADSAPIRAVAERYGLPTCPAVEVEGLPSAFICGIFRPVLALPAGTEADEKVLLHELLHLKYRDAFWGLVIAFFRCLHWCNPLLWLCANLAGNDLESLCDQRVLERLEGEDRRDYGRILLSMADEKYARAPGTSSMANGGRNIRRRIEAIARFKRYPKGMGLVSVCVGLVLAAPLLAGQRAEAADAYAPVSHQTQAMAAARTTWCTTYAGAFDTYAKAVLREHIPYRAMCAPLAEQNELAEAYRREAENRTWGWADAGLPCDTNMSLGYYICNLTEVEEDVWEGWLAVTLVGPPEGETWSGLVHERWMAIQPLRAEKEGDRWVIVPQGDFRAVQGDLRSGGNLGLPAWEYTASAGDFTLLMRRQTTSAVQSYDQHTDWFGSYSSFNTAPVLDGEFESVFNHILLARYTGAPENKENYREIAASYLPISGGEPRPALRTPDRSDSGGSSSDGAAWGSNFLEEGWTDEIFLAGGGSSREGIVLPPDAYAADFYLNGERVAELTLLPSEGGLDFD